MSLPEAMHIVSQNAHGIKHNYWLEYLPAILLVNSAYPVTGYVTTDDEDELESELVAYRQQVNENYDNRSSR